MKKFTAILVVIVLILTGLFASACFVLPHTHDFGDNYFMYTQCTKLGCFVYGRNDSEGTFLKDFVVDFDSETQAEINQTYNSLVVAIANADGTSSEVIDLFEEFDSELGYVQGQYYIASTWSDVYSYDDGIYEQYTTIANYYYQLVEKYYKLFGQIDDSKYADEFWDWTGWSAEEIKSAIDMGASYSSDSQSKVDKIVEDYYSAYLSYQNGEISAQAYNKQVNYLFGKFVAANNEIAASANYTDNRNYTDYAYENDYNREYSPAEVGSMRNYVKQYVGGIFADLAEDFERLNSQDLSTNADADFWNSMEYYPMLTQNKFEDFYALWKDFYDSKLAARLDWNDEYEAAQVSTEYVGNYFKWLNSTTAGNQEINFYKAANDVFKNGNYFIGTGDGAYTSWIPSLNKAIMFFGDGYANAFTFVHEFGHYYEHVYNGNLYLSYDHDETQSQGNEMLFLAWLSQNKGRVTDGYNLVQAYQLADILLTVIMATAVDEFEQIAYSGVTTYNGQDIPTVQVSTNEDGLVTVLDYSELFEMILKTYVSEELFDTWISTDYWKVAFDSPCYYISYAMSALVSVQIYVEAMTNGLTSARATYFKLFTFGDNTDFVGTETYDGVTHKYLKNGATYSTILKWCGLKNAFDQTLYLSLQSYFGR